ncbi:MAG: hypothetical protein SOZ80_03995 [Prevotella sp.]|uniref:hypothetical protein n=1 Tax=Prevotella sp. TaxID=59823 RepID=UPI002A32CFA2|nr:hypothetical protein [Prevotella sp.]MDD7317319.1 hypothetical protein [Prevotellaceae bacterium]MDY4019923.1 hypothetical protein [Prevotella sp.]
MKHTSVALLTAALLALLTAACSNSEFEFSSHRCYLIFDNAEHNDPTLASALVAASPGTFCRISMRGEKKFGFNSNRGLESERMMNAKDALRTCILGVYNESGIIVGYGTLGGELCAYDAQCPNCYEESNMPRYMLSMTDAGLAKCKTCKRTYDMNNGGIVIENGRGNDRKMIRYRASYADTGISKLLKVNN